MEGELAIFKAEYLISQVTVTNMHHTREAII